VGKLEQMNTALAKK